MFIRLNKSNSKFRIDLNLIDSLNFYFFYKLSYGEGLKSPDKEYLLINIKRK